MSRAADTHSALMLERNRTSLTKAATLAETSGAGTSEARTKTSPSEPLFKSKRCSPSASASSPSVSRTRRQSFACCKAFNLSAMSRVRSKADRPADERAKVMDATRSVSRPERTCLREKSCSREGRSVAFTSIRLSGNAKSKASVARRCHASKNFPGDAARCMSNSSPHSPVTDRSVGRASLRKSSSSTSTNSSAACAES